jgi:glycosyltransferase involved in cell wall biosynthesis
VTVTGLASDRQLRVIEIVTSIDQEASGPSYSVPRLSRALADLGVGVQLVTIGDPAAGVQAPDFQDIRSAKDFQGLPFIGYLSFSGAMKRTLHASAKTSDIVHSHGLWLMPNLYAGRAARANGKPHILSLRGTLSPVALERSKLKKAVFLALGQRRELRSATCLHATSEQEYADIRAYGLRQPVAIIPNGVDLPRIERTVRPADGKRKLLYLGRIHPIKGLENLLQAWAAISGANPSWELELCGPGDEPYVSEIRKLAQDMGLDRVTFSGPAYGPDKDRRYQDADLFVLPSFSENFGMSVAEALSFAVPVVTTTGTPWALLAKNAAGWSVAPEVAPLADALATAMAMAPNDLQKMGDNGRAWMARDFSWQPIARQMEALYNWVAKGGTAPETVRLN